MPPVWLTHFVHLLEALLDFIAFALKATLIPLELLLQILEALT